MSSRTRRGDGLGLKAEPQAPGRRLSSDRVDMKPRSSILNPHSSLAGLRNSTLTRLAKLGIATKFDLVLHLPLRYDDETRLYPINEAPHGEIGRASCRERVYGLV